MNPAESAYGCAWEIWIVLAVTVGQSALYSVLSLVRALLRPTPIGESADAAQPAARRRSVLGRAVPAPRALLRPRAVALVVYLLWEPGQNALRRIGLDFRRFGGDFGRGSCSPPRSACRGSRSMRPAAHSGITVAGAGLAARRRLVDGAAPPARRRCGRASPKRSSSSATCSTGCGGSGWGWWSIILATAALRGALPRLSGHRPDRRQLRDGRRVRLVLQALGPGDAAGHRAHADRRRRVHRLSARRGALAGPVRPAPASRRRPLPTPTPPLEGDGCRGRGIRPSIGPQAKASIGGQAQTRLRSP